MSQRGQILEPAQIFQPVAKHWRQLTKASGMVSHSQGTTIVPAPDGTVFVTTPPQGTTLCLSYEHGRELTLLDMGDSPFPLSYNLWTRGPRLSKGR